MKRLFLSIGGLVAVLSLAVGLNSALAHLVAAVATGLLGGAVTFLAFNRAICDLENGSAGRRSSAGSSSSPPRRRRPHLMSGRSSATAAGA